jgi:hypothetical protein
MNLLPRKLLLALVLSVASVAPIPFDGRFRLTLLPRIVLDNVAFAGIGQWKIVDLTGTKNGTNLVFTIPDVPDLNTLLIVFNGLPLRRAISSPGVLEYTISGTTITLGLAPRTNDLVCANYDID